MDFQLTDVLLRVLTEALDAVLSEGRLTTLRRWLEFARTQEPTAPIVRLAAVEIDFRTGDWTAANGRALQLARSIQTDSPLASRVYLRAGQMAHLDDRQNEALELLTAAKEQARSPHDLRRALWSRFLALCDLEERDEAERALQEVEALPPLTSEDLLRAGQGRLHFAGRWGPLVETLDNVSGLVELVEQSTDPLVRTGFLQTYGSTLGLVARYDEASAIACRQIEQAERYRLDWVLPHALEMRAVAQTGNRDFEGALRSIRRARRMANEQGNAHAEVNGVVLTARVYLCRGAAERAAELLDRRESPFTSPGMEGEYLATHALALACCSRTTDAMKLISESELVSQQLDAIALREFARLIASYFNSDNGKREDWKQKALMTAQETGNFGAFVCAYRAFPTLLQGLTDVAAVDLRPFTTLVSTLDPGLAERSGLRVKARSRTSSSEPLTRREQEILNLVSQGLSNREIARTLWITESTVKVHVRHVLAKMGVRSRSEAIAASIDSD
jgi:DNA-binding CsgD family transcriptional regulator/tetratricopeptide (TPR) repeat protein